MCVLKQRTALTSRNEIIGMVRSWVKRCRKPHKTAVGPFNSTLKICESVCAEEEVLYLLMFSWKLEVKWRRYTERRTTRKQNFLKFALITSYATKTNLPYFSGLSATVIQRFRQFSFFSYYQSRTITVCCLSKSTTGLKIYQVNTRSTNFNT